MLNIAHRGYTRDFPDNTLEAFQAARQLGVDGVEFDVQETSDNAFIIHHDDDIAGTPIARLRLTDISQIRLRGKYKIPTLQETLESCGQDMALFVELKQVRSPENLLQVLRAGTNIKNLALISFNRGLLEKAGLIAPDIMRGVIAVSASEIDEQALKSNGIKAVGIYYTHLNKELVDRLGQNNMMLYIWGCKDAEGVRQVLRYKVDGIISDCPDIVKNALRAG